MFKKIMSVVASVAMLASTVGFAAASVENEGAFGDNTFITAPGILDASAKISLTDYLDSLKENSMVITNETFTDGEIAGVKTSSQPLYLGDNMSETKTTFTDTQLSDVLASGEVEGDDGKDYEYNLKVDVPTSITKYGEPEDNINKAIVYTDFSGEESYKLRVIFPTAVDVKELAGEPITLFGKEFTFSEDKDDLSKDSITLFEQANTVRIDSGEIKTIEGHEIRADIEDSNSATIYIDGDSKNVNDKDWSGKIGGVDIYVKNIFASNVAGGQRYVQISLNAEKLTLPNGDEVERGTSEIDGTDVEIKNSEDKVREIVITVTPNDIEDEDGDNVEYLGIGDYLIDPVFKSIKFSFDSVTPDLESDDRDYIKVKTSGDDSAVIDFTNEAGKEYNFEFIDNGILNFKMVDVKEDDYFITASNEYTQIWKVESIDGNEIRIRDQGEDSDYLDLTISDDKVELPLADGGSATLVITGDHLNSYKIVNYVYTEKGALVNFTNGSRLEITEETQYNGGTFTNNSGNELGETIKLDIENPTTDISLSLLSPNYNYDEDDDNYAVTSYGTYINEHDGERIEFYYPEEAMELNFHIGKVTSNLTTNDVVTEGKVSEIIVGGSCINQVAANLLGGQLCGADFTAATGVGSGQALIKVFQDTNDKVSILVAGYEAADTARAVKYLIDNQGYIDFTKVGYSEVI